MPFCVGECMGEYCVDVVMCIDATYGMAPLVEKIKNSAATLYKSLTEKLQQNDKAVAQLRAKVIVFRDFICDTCALEQSEFYLLPDENDKFENFISSIKATGGGDLPENGLEALAVALKSEWTGISCAKRQYVLIFSDSEALPLAERADMPMYPKNLPTDIARLGALWEGTEVMPDSTYKPPAARLLAFAPEAYPWSDMQVWNRYWPTFFPADSGLSGLDMQSVIEVMVDFF